jgi:hypothetical protein
LRSLSTRRSSAGATERARTSTCVSPAALRSSTPACEGSSTIGSSATVSSISEGSSGRSVKVVRNGLARTWPWMSRTPASIVTV